MDLVTPLEVACVAWHGEVVRKMLSVSNVDANLPDKNGQTPMHVAAMNGTVDILVELLKREDIDINRYADFHQGCRMWILARIVDFEG